jgi:predicted ATP-grasp superfamily ATP-dependent carboligase
MAVGVDSGENVLLFGASVRAAAFSALRAGLRPWCADLFADADLRGRCPAMRLPGNYPHGFLDLARSDLPGPWMYTGGLENHAYLVGRMAAARPLWGNGTEALVSARDPDVLTRAARAAGMPAPVVASAQGDLAAPGRWLVKPLAGTGGAGIAFWRYGADVPITSYLQQFIEGEPAAALYLGDGEDARLLGCTRQLVGEGWLHAAAFRYCGSIGPLPLTDGLRQALGRLGAELVRSTEVGGLFGVDGVLRDGRFWPVEVNPRYTASVEVLEHATGLPALALHRAVFVEGALPPLPPAGPSDGVVGKAVLYGRDDLVFPADGPWSATLRRPAPVTQLPEFADLPMAGEPISEGRPVLTFLARGRNVADCEATLRRIAGELDRWLYGPPAVG